MIATLLDPRCKSLNFADELQKIRTRDLLKEIYNKKKQELGTIPSASFESSKASHQLTLV